MLEKLLPGIYKKLHKDLITAEKNLNEANYSSAYNIYINIISKHQNSAEIYNNLAICAHQLEKHDECREFITRAINIEPDNPLYLAQSAKILNCNEFDQAKSLFLKALSMVNNNPDINLEKSQDLSKDSNQNNINNHIKQNISASYASLLFNQGCIVAKDLKKFSQNSAISLFKESIEYTKYNNNKYIYKLFYNIACCYINLDNLDDGVIYLKKTIEQNPNHNASHFALSQYYQQVNNIALAEYHLKKYTEQNKDNETKLSDNKDYNNQNNSDNIASAEYNYGVLEQQRQNYEQAIIHYNNCLNISSNHFAACYNTASIYQKIKNINKSIEFYKKALSIKPDDASCKYLLAALSGCSNSSSQNNHNTINIEQAPVQYIENLFDSYADSFDQELITNLEYKTPNYLYDLFINNTRTEECSDLSILDLGCGTGLIGEKFKSDNYNITGVDISQNMLNKASNKNIYNNLIKSDINLFLTNNDSINNKARDDSKDSLDNNTGDKYINQEYDLIILADVLVYYGALNKLFTNIKNSLTNNGYILFSTELLECKTNNSNDQYRLNQNGRYSHSQDYINQIIYNAELNIIAFENKSIRNQNDTDVLGSLWLIQK